MLTSILIVAVIALVLLAGVWYEDAASWRTRALDLENCVKTYADLPAKTERDFCQLSQENTRLAAREVELVDKKIERDTLLARYHIFAHGVICSLEGDFQKLRDLYKDSSILFNLPEPAPGVTSRAMAERLLRPNPGCLPPGSKVCLDGAPVFLSSKQNPHDWDVH